MSDTKPKWTSRIVGHERVRADQLLANPFNHRLHPQKQRDIVNASLNEIGVVKSVQVNITTGRILDGHERVMQALDRGDGTLVDVEYVELDEEEEKKALLLLDASRDMAGIDPALLANLIDESELPDFFDDYVSGLSLSDSGPQKEFAKPLTKFARVEVEVVDAQKVREGVAAVLAGLGIDAKVEVY